MFGTVLGSAQDSQYVVFKDDAPLEVNHVRVADGAVGRKLNGRALDEVTGCHDDFIGIARHVIRNGRYMGIDGRKALDSLAKEAHILFVF